MCIYWLFVIGKPDVISINETKWQRCRLVFYCLLTRYMCSAVCRSKGSSSLEPHLPVYLSPSVFSIRASVFVMANRVERKKWRLRGPHQWDDCSAYGLSYGWAVPRNWPRQSEENCYDSGDKMYAGYRWWVASANTFYIWRNLPI